MDVSTAAPAEFIGALFGPEDCVLIRPVETDIEAGRVPCLRAGKYFLGITEEIEAALAERARRPVADAKEVPGV
jgi:hypothetical protein